MTTTTNQNSKQRHGNFEISKSQKELKIDISAGRKVPLGHVTMTLPEADKLDVLNVALYDEPLTADHNVPPETLEELLKECEDFGGKISGTFGRAASTVAKRYRYCLPKDTEREVMLEAIDVSRKSKIGKIRNQSGNKKINYPGKIPLPEKNVPFGEIIEIKTIKKEKLHWVDLDTPFGNLLDSQDTVISYLKKHFPEAIKDVCGKDSMKRSIFLDLRVFDHDDKSPYKVRRSKIYVLLGNHGLVTIHNGTSTPIKRIKSRILKDTYTDEDHKIGSGFIASKIMRAISLHNQRIIRHIEENEVERILDNLKTTERPMSRKERLEIIPELQRTIRYIHRKLAEERLSVLSRLSTAAKKNIFEGVFGELTPQEALDRISHREEQNMGLVERVESLMTRVEEVEKTQKYLDNLASSSFLFKLTFLGGLLAPPTFTLAAIDAFNMTVQTGKSLLASSFAVSAALIGLLLKKRHA